MCEKHSTRAFLKPGDIKGLELGKMVNDEMVNAHFSLLQEDTKESIFLPTWFFTKLSPACSGTSHGSRSSDRRSSFDFKSAFTCFRKQCILSIFGLSKQMKPEHSSAIDRVFANVRRIFVPIHLPHHWVLVVADLSLNEIKLFDSLPSHSSSHLKSIGMDQRSVCSLIRRFLLQASSSHFEGDVNPFARSVIRVENAMKQRHGSNDCGILMMCWAHIIAHHSFRHIHLIDDSMNHGKFMRRSIALSFLDLSRFQIVDVKM